MTDTNGADDTKPVAASEDLPAATTLYLKVLDESIEEMEGALNEMRAARAHLQRFEGGGALASIVSKFAPPPRRTGALGG